MKPDSIAAEVLKKLKARDMKLVVVESCTGGLIAHQITNVPGSSKSFWGSFTVYDNTAKECILGVPHTMLEAHGAVSPDVALTLARGGLGKVVAASHSDTQVICVATTGIAGPSGGSPFKPVGLCFLGIALTRGGKLSIDSFSKRIEAPKSFGREENKEFFAAEALKLVLDTI